MGEEIEREVPPELRMRNGPGRVAALNPAKPQNALNDAHGQGSVHPLQACQMSLLSKRCLMAVGCFATRRLRFTSE